MISPRLGAIKAPPPDRLRKGEGRAADYWGIEAEAEAELTACLRSLLRERSS